MMGTFQRGDVLNPSAPPFVPVTPTGAFGSLLAGLPGIERGGRGARVLLVHTGHLGDVLMALAAMRRARITLPNAHIVAAVVPPADDILHRCGCFDLVVPMPDLSGSRRTPRRIARWFLGMSRIMGMRPHLAVAYMPDPVDGMLAALSGAPLRIGVVKERNWVYERAWFTLMLRRGSLGPHRSGRYHAVSHAAGFVPHTGPILEDIRLSPADEALVRTHGSGQPYAVLLLCGSNTRKRWPIESFVALAQRLKRDRGLRLVMVTGPDERGMLEAEVARVSASLGAAHWRNHPLGALAGLLARCRLCVTVDTGPGHLAALTGCPTVFLAPRDKLATFVPRERNVYPVVADEMSTIGVDAVDAACTIALGEDAVRLDGSSTRHNPQSVLAQGA